ncbi:MAG TPA: matrixin family metalloprotease [Puia sp.]|nr:matrixin family metalloprotease [Puia sp.]
MDVPGKIFKFPQILREIHAILILSLALFSCGQSVPRASKVIVVQPFGDFSPALSSSLYQQLKRVNSGIVLRAAMPLPEMAYYPVGNRYQADSLIRYLSQSDSRDTILIGITNKDISTSKNQIRDWGVMGLGYRPGDACVISTYRLSKADLDSQLYKVAIHELGHTQGLSHCKDKTCFMRDADGGNPLGEEKDFCPDCKSTLRSKGWWLK